MLSFHNHLNLHNVNNNNNCSHWSFGFWPPGECKPNKPFLWLGLSTKYCVHQLFTVCLPFGAEQVEFILLLCRNQLLAVAKI